MSFCESLLWCDGLSFFVVDHALRARVGWNSYDDCQRDTVGASLSGEGMLCTVVESLHGSASIFRMLAGRRRTDVLRQDVSIFDTCSQMLERGSAPRCGKEWKGRRTASACTAQAAGAVPELGSGHPVVAEAEEQMLGELDSEVERPCIEDGRRARFLSRVAVSAEF